MAAADIAFKVRVCAASDTMQAVHGGFSAISDPTVTRQVEVIFDQSLSSATSAE